MDYDKISHFHEAIEFYTKALNIYRKLGNRSAESRILRGLGSVYLSLSQFRKSIEAYEQALDICEDLDDISSKAYCLQSIGNGHKQLENYAQAIEFYEQALAIFRKLKDRSGEAYTLSDFGEANAKLGQYKKAGQSLRQAYSKMRELEDPHGTAICLGFLGSILLTQGRYARALDVSEQCLKLYGKMNNPFLAAYYGYFLKGKALLRIGTGQKKEAQEYLQRAYQLLWSIGDKNYINQVKDELREQNIQVLQVVLDDSKVENLYITNLSQTIKQKSVQENYIQSGENIQGSEEEIITAEQVVLKNVTADSVFIEKINQIIEQIFIECNYSISSKEVESLLEKVINQIAPKANPEVRKSLAIQVVKLSLEDEKLSISSEQSSLILTKLSEISIQDFQSLLSSDEEYRKLRKRLGWLIVDGHLNGRIVGVGIFVVGSVGFGAGVGITSAYYRRIIDELTSEDEDKPNGAKNQEPKSPDHNEPDREDSERSSKKREEDLITLIRELIKLKYITASPVDESYQPVPLENSSDSEEIQGNTVARRSSNSTEGVPSSGGGGGSNGLLLQNSLQWFEDIFSGEQGGGFIDIDFGDIDLIPTATFDAITEELVGGVIGGIAEGVAEGIVGGVAEGIVGGFFEF